MPSTEVSPSNPNEKMDAGDASSETIPLGKAMLLACSRIMAMSRNVDAV